MTTIAYKDGVIAYDTRACAGNLITNDRYDKKLVRGEATFFLAGSVADFEDFLDELLADTANKEYNCGGLMVVRGELFKVGSNHEEQWMERCNPKVPIACGSGRDFALAAMDFGKSAREAVKYTMTRDNATGGLVKTYKIGG